MNITARQRRSLATSIAFVFATCLLVGAPDRASAAASPQFDSVVWAPLGCPNSDLITHASPSTADFAGSVAPNDEPAYYAYDSTFLYFRYRMDANPGSGPFAEVVWTALMQVPSGDAFEYQFQLSLNGKGDTLEIWKNDPATAQPIDFSPLFKDDAETKLYSTPYETGSGNDVVTLARSVSDGSNDYFLDFAFPITDLIAAGAIASSSDLQDSLFFPATSTNPNNYNKGYLNCPFQPYTVLDVTKSVQPTIVSPNVETPVTYTIGVDNVMGRASGITISDIALPSFLSNVSVGVATNDPAATYTIVSTNPLEVKVPELSGGKSATVTITATATAGCNTPDFTNTATVGAVNASEKSASALLDVNTTGGTETCDGLDNDCDGASDEGASCDDGNACTTDACNGPSGCSHTSTPGCEPCATPTDCTDDANACTTSTCTGGVCGASTTPGCEPCATPADCTDDANACTANTCTGGICGATTTPGCEPCATPADCTDDANACTANTCTGGICGATTTPGCEPCTTPADCTDDANACTTSTCDGGVCDVTTTSDCEPCTTPADCTDDANACTTSTCTGGVCGASTTPGCEPCTTPTDCTGDANACTTSTCDGGVCGIDTTPGCEPCTTPTDCTDDANACTTSTCDGGVCGIDTTPGCEPCTTPTDCTDDANACTTSTCDGGVCGIDTTPGCEPCTTPTDCIDDGNACTANACNGGVCDTTILPDCEPCTTPADCTDDHNACTTATCTNGSCGIDTAPGCEPCNQPSDCTDDGNACTVSTCDDSVCGAFTIADCKPCEVATDCDDDNPCTTEMCLEGACSNAPVDGCIPCETDADCDDQQACTADVCGPDGSCQITTIGGCVPCDTSADCDDAENCTTDTCSEGACAHQSIEDCRPEICTDGVDNDRDGDVDCADSDCADHPSCTTETCGNCLDDDGDGLVDYEDEDCCDTTMSLALRKMSVRTKQKVGKNRLRLSAQYAPRTPEGFDPGFQGTMLQLRDAEGDFFCQKIPFKTDSRSIKKGVFKFRDKTGKIAGGLRKARFKIKQKQNGRVVFRARGKKMSFRNVVGREVSVTIAVGNQCTTQTATLRNKKHVKNGAAFVFKRAKGK